MVAFDWRGHGDHKCENEHQMDVQTLIDDALKVMDFVMEKFPGKAILLTGHSMGGSIATKLVKHIEENMQGSKY